MLWLHLANERWDLNSSFNDWHWSCILSCYLDFWAFGKKALLPFGLPGKSGCCCQTQSYWAAPDMCADRKFCSAVPQFMNSSWQLLWSKCWYVSPFGSMATLPGRDTCGSLSDLLSGNKASLEDLLGAWVKMEHGFLRFIQASST